MTITPRSRRLLTVSAVLAVSGGSFAVAAASGTTPVYKHKDSGRTVHLAVGSKFKVSLRTCADCGDRWSWVHRPDAQVVKLVSKRVVSHVVPPAVGGIASTVYTFKVVGAGRTTEKLVEKGPSGMTVSHFHLTEVTRKA